MTVYRYELKDYPLKVNLDNLEPRGDFSVALSAAWGKDLKNCERFGTWVKFGGGRFKVLVKPDDVMENPAFKPDEWNDRRSWGIPSDTLLMISIVETETGDELARLRGYRTNGRFVRPDGESLNWFCRGMKQPTFRVRLKLWPKDETAEYISGRFLGIVAAYDEELLRDQED